MSEELKEVQQALDDQTHSTYAVVKMEDMQSIAEAAGKLAGIEENNGGVLSVADITAILNNLVDSDRATLIISDQEPTITGNIAWIDTSSQQ